MKNDIYYDCSKIISYNALLNFLIGERGVGKTYSISKFCTSQFIKKNEQFAYIRRYKSELKKASPKFFSALIKNNEFPNHNLYFKNNTFYCNDDICGFPMTLSTSQDLKSANFDNVKNIIFDEFIIDEGQKKFYLKDEVFIFLNLLETIARLRDVRVFLLGNAGSSLNPYFLYFNIGLPYNSDIKLFKNNTILVQYMHNQKYRDLKKASRFGLLTECTPYSDYAIDNNFYTDNNSFIAKKPSHALFSFAFLYKNFTFGVWNDFKNNQVFISFDYLKDSPYIFSASLNDHTDNTLFFNSPTHYNCWKRTFNAFQLGSLKFESQKIKQLTFDLFSKHLH